MTFRDNRPLCVACADAALERRGSYWSCSHCGGVLVPAADIELAMNELAQDDYRELAGRLIPRSGVSRGCPLCSTQMSLYLMHEVLVDRCPEHGIWFDGAEMQRVLDHQQQAYRDRHPRVPRGALVPLGIGIIFGALLAPWLERRALRKHVESTSPQARAGPLSHGTSSIASSRVSSALGLAAVRFATVDDSVRVMHRVVDVVAIAGVVALAAACGGGSHTTAPASPPAPQRAAIAPPPPIPEISEAPEAELAKPAGDGDASSPAPASAPAGFDVARLVGAPASERLAGSVLVWVDARFYLAPEDDAPSFQLAKLERRTDRLGEAVPMRVVASKGAFVEVESPVQDGADPVMDCAWFGLSTQLDMDRWRLFVKREDLAPVVRKKFGNTFADGSRIELLPGTPAVPLADGRTLAAVSALWVPIALPRPSLGHSYVTPARSNKEPFAPKYRLDAREVAIADTRARWRGKLAPLAERIETLDDVVAVPLSDRCGTATVVVPRGQVRPYNPNAADSGFGVGGMGSVGIGTIRGQERWYLPRGTRLVAENGKASATTGMEISVSRPARGDKRVCIERNPFISSRYLFAPKLESVPGVNVRLCAPATAVKHEKADPALGSGFGGGLGKRPR